MEKLEEDSVKVKEEENALKALAEISKALQVEEEAYEIENDEWWSNLTVEERENAFYAVVKRIYQGELKVQGSYRYVLYDVFGFDLHMYSRGMSCGYLELHNAIRPEKEREKTRYG